MCSIALAPRPAWPDPAVPAPLGPPPRTHGPAGQAQEQGSRTRARGADPGEWSRGQQQSDLSIAKDIDLLLPLTETPAAALAPEPPPQPSRVMDRRPSASSQLPAPVQTQKRDTIAQEAKVSSVTAAQAPGPHWTARLGAPPPPAPTHSAPAPQPSAWPCPCSRPHAQDAETRCAHRWETGFPERLSPPLRINAPFPPDYKKSSR